MATNYHLTETESGFWSAGATELAPGHYPANELQPASVYVAPGDYVREHERRSRCQTVPGTDESLRRAIEDYRAGQPLPEDPPAAAETWEQVLARQPRAMCEGPFRRRGTTKQLQQ